MKDEIYERLTKHLEWLEGIPDGERFNFKNVGTQNIDLSNFDLSYVDLSNIDLSGIDLSCANLTNANLSDIDLSYANLAYTNLTDANLTGANLTNANLKYAKLVHAVLAQAILKNTKFVNADLSQTDLSGAKNILNPIDYMKNNFEHDDLGWIVYKATGKTFFAPPKTWKIKPGSFLEEVVNPCRTNDCGCGVNFATYKWIRDNMSSRHIDIWKCRIHWIDACSIVVPYNTDGKCRCGRLELLEVVDSY